MKELNRDELLRVLGGDGDIPEDPEPDGSMPRRQPVWEE